MDFEDRFTSLHIGTIQRDAAIKTTGAQKRRVENVRTVGRSDDDDICIGIETVHFDQHLVQGLFTLIVRTAEPRAALTSDCIDFIYEDNTRRVTLRLIEQVANAAGAYTHEHFHELRTGDGEERDPSFARDCLRQESLTSTGRTNQQHTLGDARPKLDKLLRLLQELDHL